MILTVLIGNTNTRFGWFADRGLVRFLLYPTSAIRSGRMPRIGRGTPAAVASVVPDATPPVCLRLQAVTGQAPLIVGPRTRTGLKLRYRRKDLGADRVCTAVGAHRLFPNHDVIVVDFGTATTVNVVLREGVFAGGAILPGIGMALAALAAGTARLPHLLSVSQMGPIQHNTRDAIRAGVSNLFAGGINRIVARVEENVGRQFLMVTTGGAARDADRLGVGRGVNEPHLGNIGLAAILDRNRGTRRTTA